MTIGLGVAGGKILAFPIDFDRRPYNTLARASVWLVARENASDQNFAPLFQKRASLHMSPQMRERRKIKGTWNDILPQLLI